jgi:hypothetical protein
MQQRLSPSSQAYQHGVLFRNRRRKAWLIPPYQVQILPKCFPSTKLAFNQNHILTFIEIHRPEHILCTSPLLESQHDL